MGIKRRHSLTYKQTLITVMTVFFIGLVISFYQIAVDLEREKRHVDEAVSQVLHVVESSAAQAAYNLDNSLARQVVNGLFEYPPVFQVEIQDDLGKQLASADRPRVDFPLRQLADLLMGNSKAYRLELEWSERAQPVGSISVMIDPYLVTLGFFDRARLILLFSIIQMLVLALLLSIMFYLTLTKPLMKTAASFAAINPGDEYNVRIAMPSGHQDDEIGLLVDKGNRVFEEYRQHIWQQEESEAELNRLRNLLTNVVDSMPSSLICVDVACRVIQWNRQAEQLTGVSASEAEGEDLMQLFPQLAQEMGHIKDAVYKGLSSHDQRLRFSAGEVARLYDVTIYPLTTNGIDGAVIRIDDVTERVRIEEMMIQSEKMLSVGGLAAGMAHEINNPLAGILQNVQVMQNRISPDLAANIKTAEACGTNIDSVSRYLSERKVYEMIERIRESGKRAAKIVDNMLSFSRKGSRHLENCNMRDLMEQSLELAANDYRLEDGFDFRQIQIIREYDEQLCAVECEPSHIQQVLLNLLKNGAQAMAECRPPLTDPRFILRIKGGSQRIRVEVEDNGPGIPEELTKRIFEPFFTTKPIGVGTGLGLSVSYFIIRENYGGDLRVENVPGSGARFVLQLPGKRSLPAG
ncbi:two-component system sensor histidine kinase NtrB [Sedimenticola thiotaurini]|uniref:two-component system sensor histidine kinase NtrB n=1 Tax=Sedimenticola thiotaurini TaxID=1543721 RepID=UPI000B2F36F4|nr:ATP-binding protein [Sedimenticola thiotaurini]